MPVLPRLRGVLRSLAGRGAVDRDLDAEVRSCFAMLVDEKMAAGMSAAEARRQAQLEIGGVEQVKESVRSARPAAWVETIARDVRYAFRLLVKTPAFSATAVLVLALGIGANAAVFSVVNILYLRPLPGSGEPGLPVAVFTRDPARPNSYRSFSYLEFEAVRDQATVFDRLMAHAMHQVAIADGDASRRTRAELITGNYFTTLGVRLAAGRSFSREEERAGSRAAVMVISHPYWQELGSPPDIIGKTILVNSYPFTVIGLAPAGFAGRIVLAGPQIWLPLGAAALFADQARDGAMPSTSDDGALGLMLVGRLKPGLTTDAANAALEGMSRTLGRSADGTSHQLTVTPVSRFNQGTAPERGDLGMVLALGALEGAALIVLLIASLNVANMQLARGSSRRKEIAMRLALGAGRARIMAQLMTEALLVTLAGGALGMIFAVWTLRAVLASLVLAVPDAVSADIWPDWRVALACLACCALSAVASGVGPSWRLSRLNLVPEMKSQEGVGAGLGLRRFGTRNLLVAGQIALSLALLAASGLFVRGAMAARADDPGYSFDGQLLMSLDAAGGGLGEKAGRRAYEDLLEKIRRTPGVESASIASYVAFANQSSSRRVWRPGTAESDPGRTRGVSTLAFDVGARYFRTLGLPMLRGREFTAAEEWNPTAPPVAIIDEPLAAVLFPGIDPVGQFVEFSGGVGGAAPPRAQVVGVARGQRHRLTDAAPIPHLYLPVGSHYRALLHIHVRASSGGGSDRTELRAALRDTAPAADTKLTLLALQSLDEARDSMPINWIVRTAARVFGAFGAIALFMAAIGLYGVRAYVVARRTREIGIRMAIGADAGDVIRMVLKEGALLLAASIGLGILLAIAVGQAVSSLLVGVRPFDPLVLAAATLVLSAAVLAACYVPARRATRIAPVTALRVE